MVYEQIDIKLVARRCEWKILRCHQKGLFLSFRDAATGPDQANIKWLLTRPQAFSQDFENGSPNS